MPKHAVSIIRPAKKSIPLNSSFVATRNRGIDMGRADERNHATGKYRYGEHSQRQDERGRIAGDDVEQQAAHEAARREGSDSSEGSTEDQHERAIPQNQSGDVAAFGPERHSHTDFERSLPHRERERAKRSPIAASATASPPKSENAVAPSSHERAWRSARAVRGRTLT